ELDVIRLHQVPDEVADRVRLIELRHQLPPKISTRSAALRSPAACISARRASAATDSRRRSARWLNCSSIETCGSFNSASTERFRVLRALSNAALLSVSCTS